MKYDMIENIKYWRNQNQNEVDFIIGDKKAYEVKFSKSLVQKKKYELFETKYPNLDLEFITFDEFLEFMVKKLTP
jgi:predicted AAA+ superfamily ATPase